MEKADTKAEASSRAMQPGAGSAQALRKGLGRLLSGAAAEEFAAEPHQEQQHGGTDAVDSSHALTQAAELLDARPGFSELLAATFAAMRILPVQQLRALCVSAIRVRAAGRLLFFSMFQMFFLTFFTFSLFLLFIYCCFVPLAEWF